jgi:transcriptional regulator with XRE-family HTH domain
MQHHDTRDGSGCCRGGDTDRLVNDSLPPGSFGALLRACRHRACLSQEQLAARAELSERTVRNLEAGRVRSPRIDTVRLLADALQLGEPERESWFEAAPRMDHQRAGPAAPRTRGAAQLPGNVPAQLPLSVRFRDGEQHPAPPFARQELQAEIVELCQPPYRPAAQVAQDVDLTKAAVRGRAGSAGAAGVETVSQGIRRCGARCLQRGRRGWWTSSLDRVRQVSDATQCRDDIRAVQFWRLAAGMLEEGRCRLPRRARRIRAMRWLP